MNNQNPLMVGIVALVVGILLGAMIGRSIAPDGDSKVSERLAAIEEASADLGSRLDGVEGQLGEIGTSIAGLEGGLSDLGGTVEAGSASAAEATAGLSEEITGLGASLTSAIADQQSAAQGQFDTLSASLAGLAAGGVAAVASNAGATATDTDTAEAAAPAAAEAEDAGASDTAEAGSGDTEGTAAPMSGSGSGDGLGVGQTAVFADGALRVFVSRLDAEAGEALVAINGLETAAVTVGRFRNAMAGETLCRVTLDGISDDGAELSHLCGDDVPAPSGATVGQTIALSDGGARVFVSRIDAELDQARVAINGLDTVDLMIGETVDVEVDGQSCGLTLESLDRGHADLSVSC